MGRGRKKKELALNGARVSVRNDGPPLAHSTSDVWTTVRTTPHAAASTFQHAF